MATKKPNWITRHMFTKSDFWDQICQQYGGSNIHVLFYKSRSYQI